MDQMPGPRDAVAVVQHVLRTDVAWIERFATGAAHFVYDIRTSDGQQLVVRLTRPSQRWMFEGALYWHDQLAPRGVPLPRLIHVELGNEASFPVMLMERLPGADLGHVYPSLDQQQKRSLAQRIAAIQRAVASLPLGAGFGYAASFDDPYLKPTWRDLIESHLDRSEQRIAEVGVVDPSTVERVRRKLDKWDHALAALEPRCFLDDTTTKNVIVHNGELSGIVDVDSVCFGDPLYTVALTNMSLLARGWPTDYVDAWCEVLNLHAKQHQLIDLYTAVFCVDFLSEQGQQFNQDAPPVVDQAAVQQLMCSLDQLLAAI